MKNKILLLPFAAALVAFGCSDKAVTVNVENPSSFDRKAELVEVPVADLGKVNLGEGEVYLVKNAAGETVPSQVTYDGKLVFQSGLAAGETAKFSVSAGQEQQFEPMTYGRFVPERKDDFVWENDRVAFRAYGPALIATDGPSTGFDAWYKRTSKLVVDEWYADELAGKKKYHDDHGEGLDDYSVGPTLGAGAPSVYAHNRLYRNKNFREYEVLENGPLRTTFRLVYDDIDVEGEKISEVRTVSLDAGSQMNRITVDYGMKNPGEIAAGFPMRQLNDYSESTSDYIIYPEPATKKAEGVWLGLVMPGGLKTTGITSYTVPEGQKQAGEYLHFIAVKPYTLGQPVTYYAGFGWEKWGFPTLDDFRKYISDFSAALSEPLKVTVE